MKSRVLAYLLGLVCLFMVNAQSQVNRYFIYFTDKSSETYPYTVEEPEQFLSQRAIERRLKQGIAIEAEDLPVAPSYVEGLKQEGADVFFTSRWLNGALVNADTNQLATLSQLSFVDSIAWIADTTVLRRNHDPFKTPTKLDTPTGISGDSNIQLGMLGGFYMHTEGIKGQGKLIAILDNGYRGIDKYTPFQHLWDSSRIVATRDFVENSNNVFQYGDHGSAVLSIIGSNYESAEGDLVGIAPEANYILCVTEENGSEDRVEEYNWLLGAEYADSLGADVLNASLGYKTFDIAEHNYTSDQLDGTSSIVSWAASKAATKGMIIVTSAGNSGRRQAPANLMSHPADAEGILTVGSVNGGFQRSSFSSIGPTADGRIKPEVAAFGSGTTVFRGNGGIERGNGTSFASPLIAGFAACMWQLHPNKTSKELISMIKQSGHQSTQPDTLLGWGVPHYAYMKANKKLDLDDIFAGKVLFYPYPFKEDSLILTSKGEFSEDINIRIMDPNGSLIYNETYAEKENKTEFELSVDGSQQGVYFLFLQVGTDQKIVKLINF